MQTMQIHRRVAGKNDVSGAIFQLESALRSYLGAQLKHFIQVGDRPDLASLATASGAVRDVFKQRSADARLGLSQRSLGELGTELLDQFSSTMLTFSRSGRGELRNQLLDLSVKIFRVLRAISVSGRHRPHPGTAPAESAIQNIGQQLALLPSEAAFTELRRLLGTLKEFNNGQREKRKAHWERAFGQMPRVKNGVETQRLVRMTGFYQVKEQAQDLFDRIIESCSRSLDKMQRSPLSTGGDTDQFRELRMYLEVNQIALLGLLPYADPRDAHLLQTTKFKDLSEREVLAAFLEHGQPVAIRSGTLKIERHRSADLTVWEHLGGLVEEGRISIDRVVPGAPTAKGVNDLHRVSVEQLAKRGMNLGVHDLEEFCQHSGARLLTLEDGTGRVIGFVEFYDQLAECPKREEIESHLIGEGKALGKAARPAYFPMFCRQPDEHSTSDHQIPRLLIEKVGATLVRENGCTHIVAVVAPDSCGYRMAKALGYTISDIPSKLEVVLPGGERMPKERVWVYKKI